MRVLLAILLTTCVFGANLEYLEEISHQDFGKTLLEALQVELSQGGSPVMEKIMALHNGMASDIQTEQKEEYEAFTWRHDQLLKKAAEAQEAIDRAAGRKATDEMSLPLKEEELQSKKEQLNSKTEEETRNLDKINALKAARKQSRAEYEERRDELTALLGTLKEAKVIIQQLKQSGFLQLNEHVFAQVKEHQEKFTKAMPKKKRFNGLVNTLLVAMQDRTLHADQGVVDQLLEIVDELMEAVYGVQKQEMQAEDARQTDFIKETARIQWVNRRLDATLAQAKADVEVLKQRILELQNDIATQTQIVEIKTKERDDWLSAANEAQTSFSKMTDNRTSQLATINTVVSIITADPIGAASLIQSMHLGS